MTRYVRISAKAYEEIVKSQKANGFKTKAISLDHMLFNDEPIEQIDKRC